MIGLQPEMRFLVILVILVGCLLLAGLVLLPPHTAVVVVGAGLPLLVAVGILWAIARCAAALILKIRATRN